MRVAELLASPQYRYVQAVNRRNAQRLAAKAARALGLTVDVVEDVEAHVDNAAHDVRPMLAVPTVHDEYNVIRPLSMAEVGNVRAPLIGADASDVKKARAQLNVMARAGGFVLYDHTYNTATAKNGLVVMQAPQAPLLLFAQRDAEWLSSSDRSVARSMSTTTTTTTLSAVGAAISAATITNANANGISNVSGNIIVSDVSSAYGVTRNAAADSFPCSLGYNKESRIASSMPPLSPGDVSIVDRRLTWENKWSADTQQNSNITYVASSSTSGIMYRRYDPSTITSSASAPGTEDWRLRETFRALCSGGVELVPSKLLPVAVKISSEIPIVRA